MCRKIFQKTGSRIQEVLRAFSLDSVCSPWIQCILLGFSEDQGMQCYIGYDFKTGKLHCSVNIWWDETFFPCREKGDRRITSLEVFLLEVTPIVRTSTKYFQVIQNLAKYNSKCMKIIKIV